MKQRIRIQNKDKTARIFLPVHDFAELVRHMYEHGGKTAFMWNAREGEGKDGAINYELLAEEVELAAASLTEEGLAGRRIAFLGMPSVTYAVFMLATLATGGVIVPLDHERPTEDIARLITRAGASALSSTRRCSRCARATRWHRLWHCLRRIVPRRNFRSLRVELAALRRDD